MSRTRVSVAEDRPAGDVAVPLTIGVLICSYRRPKDLLRGLAALTEQKRRPDDVIVVARADDTATLNALASRQIDGLPLRTVTVRRPGTVHALNAGLDACRADVVAVTDDDTVPHCDWLSRIVTHFGADPTLGGLGGRDWCHDGTDFDRRSKLVVGRLQWFGRTIGNSHLGVGEPREVDFLKGANMSYRIRALGTMRFDTRLRGRGAQPYEDIAFSLAVQRAGWKLIYDPLVAVDHYPGPRKEPRHYSGITAVDDTDGLFEFAHNEVIAIWETLSTSRRIAYIFWSVLVGTGVSPGLAQAFRYTPRLGRGSWLRLKTVQKGKLAALRLLLC